MLFETVVIGQSNYFGFTEIYLRHLITFRPENATENIEKTKAKLSKFINGITHLAYRILK